MNNLNRTSRQLSELYAKAHQTAQALEEQLAAFEHTQDQLRQAQKMEAVGRLAGGVAHDFNNLLTVISGYSELSCSASCAPRRPAAARSSTRSASAAERAAALTRQLLAFSRKQVLQPRVLDLNAVVAGHRADAAAPDRRGHRARHRAAAATSAAVKADPGQIEQVLMNLAVNARDAMPHGRHARPSRRANVELDEASFDDGVRRAPGRYVLLAVTDTGSGHGRRDVQAHIFEPFFTTKEPGKGTGLGLADGYGIVKQSGGHIEVDSEPGQGTTFKIYLPPVGRTGPEPMVRGAAAADPGQGTRDDPARRGRGRASGSWRARCLQAARLHGPRRRATATRPCSSVDSIRATDSTSCSPTW